MRYLLPGLLLSAVLLPSTSRAGSGGTLYEEDFESGSYPGWILSTAGLSHAWNYLAPGECGAPSGALAYAFPATCSYVGTGPNVSNMSAPPFHSPDAKVAVQFQYRLELDAVGDSFSVYLSSGGTYVLVTDSSLLVADGALHTHSSQVLLPSSGSDWRLRFSVSVDAVGNTGSGVRIDDIVVREVPPALAFCAGDGASAPCPCGNLGSSGAGCANSAGPGALASASGSAALSLDDLVVHGSGLAPGQAALLFAGELPVHGGLGASFGDGLRCAGTGARRLGVATASSSGGASWGPGLGAALGASSGDTRYLQLWYRDPLGPCGSGFNLSNGLSLTLEP